MCDCCRPIPGMVPYTQEEAREDAKAFFDYYKSDFDKELKRVKEDYANRGIDVE